MGVYSYRVPPHAIHLWDNKTKFILGKSLAEAHKVFSDRLGEFNDAPKTVADLLDQYKVEVVSQKAVNTQKSNRFSIRRLRATFANSELGLITPKHVYQYIRECAKVSGPVSAERDVEVLSHAYTKAVEWGIIERHPFKNEVRIEKKKSGEKRFVEDWEVEEVLKLEPARNGNDSTLFLQSYIKLKLLTGLRQQDLLCLKESDLTDKGILVKPMKTSSTSGKTLLIQWTDDLRVVVDECRSVRPCKSEFLFCNKRGESYYDMDKMQAQGFKAMFRRFVQRAIDETNLFMPFTEHSLRAKAACSTTTLAEAQALLGHSSTEITRRVYRRGVEAVNPNSLSNVGVKTAKADKPTKPA